MSVSSLPDLDARDLLPPAPALRAEDEAVVTDALALVHPLLDDLRAGPLARAGLDADVKSDGTPVTAADLEVDQRIVDAVSARFPGHDVVSEELDPRAGGASWTWVVDPVDGTSNFSSGLSHWGVSIALCREGVPVAGVVDAVGRDRFVAIRGGEVRRNGEAVRTRADVGLPDPGTGHLPLLTTFGSLRRARHDGGVVLNPRVLGATAVDLALVAAGVAVGVLTLSPRVWDVAAGAVLVESAGGGVLTVGGRSGFPLEAGRDYEALAVPTLAASSPALARELLARLTPVGGSLVGTGEGGGDWAPEQRG